MDGITPVLQNIWRGLCNKGEAKYDRMVAGLRASQDKVIILNEWRESDSEK